MSFFPMALGQLSLFILNNVENQLVSSTSYADLKIATGYTTIIDSLSMTLAVDTAADRVTLPAGKFFLDGRLTAMRASTASWGVEYTWYSWDGATRTDLGCEGREVGALAIGDPAKNEHARAYIESDGTAIIGMRVKTISSSSVEVNDTQWEAYSGQGRLMIWGLE